VKRVEFGNDHRSRTRRGDDRRDESPARGFPARRSRPRYVYDVRREQRGPQVHCRAHPTMASFWEVQNLDNVIEVKSVARDPGSRADRGGFAGYTIDRSAPASAPDRGCGGVSGCRARRSISFHGHRMPPPSSSALQPAEVVKVVLDEDSRGSKSSCPMTSSPGDQAPQPKRPACLAAYRLDIIFDGGGGIGRRQKELPTYEHLRESAERRQVVSGACVGRFGRSRNWLS
jgi:N utilization substance protein A